MPRRIRRRKPHTIPTQRGRLALDRPAVAELVDYALRIIPGGGALVQITGWIVASSPEMLTAMRAGPAGWLTLPDGQELRVVFTQIVGVFTAPERIVSPAALDCHFEPE